MANRTGEGGATRQARGAGQSANGGARSRRRADRTRSGPPSETDRRLREAEMLLNLTRTVAAYETLDEVLGALVGMTTREVGAERQRVHPDEEDERE